MLKSSKMWYLKKFNIFVLTVLSFLTLRVEASAIAQKQKVCVIGAGASGLASVKQLADHPEDFDVVVFEKSSEVGGLWNYTDSIDVDEHNLPIHTSMYKNLRTNLPKELMAFPDYRDFSGEERSCVTHETVLDYLKNYTDHFNLRKYIQFHTLVEKVTPILGEGDWRTTKWQLETKNLDTNEKFSTVCNAVMVCNGHQFQPRVPKIPGIESFPGKVLHSHVYRKPEDYKDQTVVILGAAMSGIDISIEIAEFAKTVYLSHNKEKINATLPSNIIQVPGVISANGSTLTLKDGSTINADTFMYCTGYVYIYPFLDGQSSIEVHDNQVLPLYKQLINVEHPSMCLVGLPLLVLHFPLFYIQVHYFISLLQGKVVLPSKVDMLKDNELNGKLQRYAHLLGPAQWDYNDKLAEAGGFESLPAFYKKGSHIWNEYRAANVATYKQSNLRIGDNGEVQLQHPFT